MSERISKESLLKIKELRDEMKDLVNKLKSDEEWDSFTAFYVQNSFLTWMMPMLTRWRNVNNENKIFNSQINKSPLLV